jgi:hypothetical protein
MGLRRRELVAQQGDTRGRIAAHDWPGIRVARPQESEPDCASIIEASVELRGQHAQLLGGSIVIGFELEHTAEYTGG